MASDPVDLDLVRKVQAGDTAAFRTMVERHGRPIYGFFVRSLRNEALAEEFFQETFLRCFQHLRSFDPDRLGSDFKVWLFRMAVNLLRDQLRKAEVQRAVAPTLGAVPAEPPTGDPESDAVLAQLRDQVRDAIPRLPDLSREVLVLRYYRGLSYVQIAQVLGIPAGTVKSRMHQAVEALRRFFPVADVASVPVSPQNPEVAS